MSFARALSDLKSLVRPAAAAAGVLCTRRTLAIAASATTTFGWSLLWAQGLGLVAVPPAAPILVFAFGLALIPLAIARVAPEKRAQRDGQPPALEGRAISSSGELGHA